MKKLEIKTEKATLLVVDINEGDIFINSPTSFKHLGKVSEITEEEWADITEDGDMTPSSCTYTVGYRDYTIDELTPMFEFDNATESGLSLLKANGVLLENKYPHPDNIKIQPASLGWYKEQLDKHNSEQQKIWSNPHVFIKVD